MIEIVNNRCCDLLLKASANRLKTCLEMDALARKFAVSNDMKVKAEIDRLSSELVWCNIDFSSNV